jgi:hypothetical protein
MASRPAVGRRQLAVQWALGAVSTGVKYLGHELGHSPPSGAEVEISGLYSPPQ